MHNASNSGGLTPLKSKWTTNGFFLAAAAMTVSVAAIAGQAQPKAKTVPGGESGLVGIKLYDTGSRVISVYGNPTEILPVGFGGGAIGPAAGGGGGPAGARGGIGGAPGGAGGGGGAAASAAVSHNPNEFGFGDEMLGFQRGGKGGGLDDGDVGGGGGGGVPQPGPGLGGPPPGAQGAFPGGPPRGGGAPGGGGMAGGGNTGKILYTRWVYRRGPSKYGFILDKYNRVVQVEAIGMADSRVKTSKGIRFGSTFGDIIKKYQTPDGYEINGDSIVMRYLVRNKVAFRLSRLGEKKPHVVTGVVVAGGKT